jgi:hypothetical protein
MRNFLTLILLFVPIILSAQEDIFVPDTSVSGIKLQDPISLKALIPNILELKYTTGPGSRAFLQNKDGSENLTLTFHAGSTAYEVAEMHISAIKSEEIKNAKTIKLNIDRFITESNIKLNIRKTELIKIKGTNYETAIVNGNETLKYIIVIFETSSFLRRYNLPIYYANYTFKDDRLIIIDFGFEYP